MESLNTKITEALKAELTQWLETFWKTYLKGDYELWATFVADDYYNIGGTKEEIWHSKQEILEYSYALQDQMVGQAEIRNRTIEVLPYGDYLMVNEFTDLYVKIDGKWTFYGPFRMSSLMSKTETGWIALHQHGSYPDMKATEGEAFGADALKAENKRLQKAVDQRTSELLLKNRELEIEAALEKVRTAAMGMNTPNDMLQVCRVIAQQLEVIGLDQIRNVQTAIIEAQEEIYLCYQYFPSYDRDIIERTEYRKNPVEQQMVNQMLAAKDSHFLGELNGKELQDFISHRKQENHFKDPLLEESDNLGYCFLSIGEGGLGLTLYKSLDEQSLTIFKRFHQVFSLAYQRFRDIQKAEAQAREAQIEATLERLRSRSLAMQKSEELAEASILLEEEVRKLGIENWGCAFHIYDEETTSGKPWDLEWFTSSAGFLPFYKTPRENVFLQYYNESKKGNPLYIQEFGSEVIKQHYDYLKTLPVLGEALTELHNSGVPLPESQIDHVAFFNHGHLLFITYKPIPEAHDIFIRFAKVFNQAYTRFLDLQKAEAQARESEIQLALERVRARTMAMQKSDELRETIGVIFEQLVKLKFDVRQCSVTLINHEKREIESFQSAEVLSVLPQSFKIPFMEGPFLDKLIQWGLFDKSGYTVNIIEGDDKVAFDDFMFENTPLQFAPKEVVEFMRSVKKLVACRAHMNYGMIEVVTNDEPISEEQAEILQRFSQVFEQTYTRFLDLQKAEEQAMEAQIESALERVRSRTMAMHNSDELINVATTMNLEFQKLGVTQSLQSSFVLIDEEKELQYLWGAQTDTELLEFFALPLYGDNILKARFESWKRKEPVFNTVLESKNLQEHLKVVIPAERRTAREVQALNSMPDPCHFCCGNFSYGYLLLISTDNLTEQQQIIVARMAKVFEQTYTRFLDLKKAEAQAREAQIEASLERIRAKAMAMHHSDELDEVLAVLCEQFDTLGIFPMSTHMTVLDIDNNKFTFRETGKFGDRSFGEQTVALNAMDTWKDMVQSWKSADPYSINRLHFPKETLPQVWDVFHESFASMPEGSKITPDDYPDGIYHTAGKHPFGYIGMNQVRPATEKEEQIVIKFANEFGRTYQRFLDLQKAEAQAREAKIEAALEKVRSRTMAMQKGEEVKEVVVLLYKELIALGVTNFVSCGYVEINEETKRQETWVTSPGGDSLGLFYLPLTGDVHFDARYKAWKEQQTVFHQTVGGNERKKHLEYAITTFNSKEAEEMVLSEFPDPTVFYCFNFSHGYLHVVAGSYLQKDEEALLARFTRVFEQTYARFLDLQKAEEQAREAQIEAAMERIRSRAIAMRTSEELMEVMIEIRRQIDSLGQLDLEASVVHLYTEGEKMFESIAAVRPPGESGEIVLADVHFPVDSMAQIEHMMEMYTSDTTEYTIEFDKQMAEEWQQVMLQYAPMIAERRVGFVDNRRLSDHSEFWNFADFNGGSLLLVTHSPASEDTKEVLRKASKVFNLAYGKYQDLLRAEARAREAQIEAALERIRGQVASMTLSTDLLDIVVTMRTEFTLLGHEAGYFWHMRWLDKTYEKAMTSGDGTKIGMIMSLPRHIHGDIKTVADWEKGKDPILVLDMDTDSAVDYVHKMITLGDFEQVDPNAPTLDDIRHIQGLTFVMARTTHGEIGFSLPGKVPSPQQESMDTLIRFAGVFDLAYKRFEDLLTAEANTKRAQEDLIKLKKSKSRAEKALKELKSAQEQLVQQEKLASLGQLTAGIAHEIKNPLNFVNNFSDLSRELVEEVFEELEKLDSSEIKEEIIFILNDVKSNLLKVHEHGSRADGIVTSMLQHSRASGNKREAKEFNPLVKEYVNLSFHGMRAGKSPINVEIVQELDPKVGEVTLIQEDFSRVILNLCNNAFDAMRDKLKSSEDYLPKLSVKTSLQKDRLILSIADNGGGIPKEIQDKILQPFFTTKKGTEGTGLGLSITHDIIKAHGGELKMETSQGKGSIFSISIPVH